MSGKISCNAIMRCQCAMEIARDCDFELRSPSQKPVLSAGILDRVLQEVPLRGRQLYFTFSSAPDPLFKASKHSFLPQELQPRQGHPIKHRLNSRDLALVMLNHYCDFWCTKGGACGAVEEDRAWMGGDEVGTETRTDKGTCKL